jgi:hypothetical protein
MKIIQPRGDLFLDPCLVWASVTPSLKKAMRYLDNTAPPFAEVLCGLIAG